MNIETIKESLNNNRLNKIIFWNLLFGLIGGTVWLSFRLAEHKGPLEIFFMTMGIILMLILIRLIYLTNKEINKYWLILKNKKE